VGTYKSLTGRANSGDGLEAHELIRHEAIEQMGCGSRTKSGKVKRHPDNPSIALTPEMHDRVHLMENQLAREHLGNGVNVFDFSNGKPTKQQIDIWQGALRKGGMSASQARRLKKRAQKFLKTLC